MSLFVKRLGLEGPNHRFLDFSGMRRLMPALILTIVVLGMDSRGFGQADWKGLARQNEYLREHFREEYRLRTGRTGEVYQSTPSYSQRGINSSLGRVARDFDEEREIDRFINRQIQILVDEVDKKGRRIESTLGEISDACNVSADGGDLGENERLIRKGLSEVSKNAGQLLDRLEAVFRDLERQEASKSGDLPMAGSSICSLAGLKAEGHRSLDALHLSLAGSPVVAAVELRDWNFLIGLSRISEWAAALSQAAHTANGP